MFSILIYLLPFVSSVASANVVPGDKDYQTFERAGYQYVYSDDHVTQMPLLIEWNEWFKTEYQKSYQWRFDQEAALVLASGQNQIGNGFATVVPHLKTVFYPAGALMRDQFAVASWMKVLLIHETAHLYQLNVKDKLPETVRTVIGNTVLIPTPIGVPLFIHPNIFLPTFVLEGNAMMNESRWGIGGRLHSGEIRALTYSQVLNDQIDATRLINDHLDFPFGSEKYYQGGHFQLYLAEKYGIEQTNAFFKNHGEHFFNPFLLDDSFRRTFGSGYNQLITEYKHDIKKKAAGQRSLPEPALDTSWFYSPLNHDSEEVFFLVPQKGKSYPWLWQISKGDGHAIKKRRIDLASGKVFKTDRGWATASAKQESPSLVEFGLYLEKLYPHPDFRSMMVTDLRAGHLLSLDPVKSFNEGHLYLDKKFFGIADSDSLLDENGSVYYFRQFGTERTLFRDEVLLFSFDSYYGKLMEIDDTGGVYFVAGTDKGSSLFYWDPRERDVKEVLPSDQILEARRLSDGRFLAVEVDYSGYKYKIAESKIEPELPFNFVNPVEATPATPPPLEASASTFSPEQGRNYNSLRDLRYDNLDFFYGAGDDDDLTGSVSLNFSDPLAWNSLNLSYARNSYQRDTASLTYQNNRHQLGYSLGYYYDEDALVVRKVRQRLLHENAAYLALHYPLFIHGRWSSTWAGRFLWQKEDRVINGPDDNFNFKNSLFLNWGINYPLAYQTFRGFSVGLNHELKTEREPFRKTDDLFSGSARIDYDLGYETYFWSSYRASFAEKDNITIDNSFLPAAITDDYYSSAVNREYRLTSLQIKEVGLKKALNHSYYFPRFPVSLRRWAPFLQVRHYDLDNPSDELPSAFWEYELGAEVELLIFHRIPMRAGWSIHAADPEPFNSGLNSGWNFRLSTFKSF